MKKIFLPITLILLLALAACGGDAAELVNEASTRAGDVAATAATVATDVANEPDSEAETETDEPEVVEEAPETDEPEVEAAVEPEPVVATAPWTGSTIATDGSAVSDVQISISASVEGTDVDAETQSDANGAFSLDAPLAEDGRYVINAEKEGYLPVSLIHIGSAVEGLALEFQEVQTTIPFDPTVGVEAKDDAGTQISIGANQLEDANGNEPVGDVELNMYTYDLENEEMVGDMSGTNTDGEPVFMESEGAFYASFEDEAGNELNLKEGETAEISIPCEPRPNEVLTVWSYDESTGLWVEEVPATIEGDTCSAQVYHFSYWNFDYEKREPACVKLEIDADYLAVNTPLNVKAILQTNPVRVQQWNVTDTENVLYNLPTNIDVQFFMPSDAATPFATVNSGAPWGDVGVPPQPYDVCNGVAEVAPAKLILQSVNFPERYLAANADGTAVELLPVSPDSDDELKQRATFTQVPGLANGNMVSLQTNSGAYVVATPDGVTLQASPDTDDLRRAATFNRIDGLAGKGESFESLAYPGYYLRHSSYVLRLNTSDDSILFKEDASYNGVTEFVAAQPAEPVAEQGVCSPEPGWVHCRTLTEPKITIYGSSAVSESAMDAVQHVYSEMTARFTSSYPREKMDDYIIYITNGEQWSELANLVPVGTMWGVDANGVNKGDELRGGTTLNYLWISEQMICKTGVQTRNDAYAAGLRDDPDNAERTFDQVIHEFGHAIGSRYGLDARIKEVYAGGWSPVEQFPWNIQHWFGTPSGTLSESESAFIGEIFNSTTTFSCDELYSP